MKTHFESKQLNGYVHESDWYRFDADRLCAKLNTDKEKGLREDVIEQKKTTNPKNNIFDADPSSRGNVPKTVWPVLAGLLSALLLISGFVLKDGTSWLSLILTVLGYAAVYAILALSIRAASMLEEYSVPNVTVVRNGVPEWISQREILQGDLILLSEGDIVPCDGRIISENGLFVLEKNISGGSGKKDAAFMDKTVGLESSNQMNMVFARSIVSAGSCRIIACDVGAYTLCVRRGIKSKKGKSTDLQLFDKMAKFSRVYSICCSALVFVITLFSFLLRDNTAVYSSFLISLSIAVSSFCELAGALSYAAVILGVFPGDGKKNKSGVVIKNLSSLERMRRMTSVFLPKNSGICQNRVETELTFTNERELLPVPENKEKLRRLVYIAVSTFGGRERHAKKQTAQTDEQDAFTATASSLGISLAEIESSMIPLMLSHAYGSRMFETALVYYKDQYMVCVRGNAVQIISRCTSKLSNGSPVYLSEEGRRDLIARAEKYESDAYRVAAIASKISKYNYLNQSEYFERDLCFEGFFIMREPYSSSVEGAVAALSNMGVQTVMFCDDTTTQSVNLARNVGICRDATQKLTALELVKSNLNIVEIKMPSYRLFCGFSNEQKKYITDAVIEAGKKIGVVGRHLYDVSLMNGEQTVAFAVSSTLGSKKPEIDENGFYVPETSEALKRASDVIITPADKKGRGGVNAVMKAVTMSRKVYNNVYNAMVYLTACNAVRFVLSTVSVFTGLFRLTPAQMLFSGMAIDLLAVLSIFLSDNREMSLAEDLMKRAEKKKQKKRPLLSALTYFVSALVSVAVTAAAALLCGLDGAQTGVTVFAALVFTQLAACRQISRGRYGFKAGLTGMFVILVLIAVEYFALSAVFDAFFTSYMTGGAGFFGIFLCLIAPVIFTAAVRIGYILRRKK